MDWDDWPADGKIIISEDAFFEKHTKLAIKYEVVHDCKISPDKTQ